MPVTAIDFTTLKNKAMAMINVSTTAYGTYDLDPGFFEAFIDDAIYDADLEIRKAIVANPKHPQRTGYLTTAVVTDGALLPAAPGDLGPIEITTTAGDVRTDRQVDIGDIEAWKKDTAHVLYGSLDDIEGHFAIQGQRIRFIGQTCTVTLPGQLVRGSAHVITSPIEYINTALALSVGSVLMKDPEFSYQSGTAMSVGMAGIQAITRGELVVPELRAQMLQQAA